MIKRTKLIAWSYFSQLSNILSNLILVILLTRLLGVRNYGIWVQALTAISFSGEILGLNLGHALLRFSPTKTIEERSSIFWVSVLTQWSAHFLIILLLLPFSRAIGNFLFNIDDSLTIVIILIISGLLTFQNLMRNFLINFGKAILVGQFAAFSSFLIVLITIVGGFVSRNFEGALYGLLLGRFLENLMLFLIVRKELSHPNFIFSIFTKLINFSLPLLPVGIALWVCQLSDRLFIKFFIGLEAVAKYGVSYSLPAMVSLIYISLSNIFFSLIVNLYETKQYQKVSWWISSMIRIYFVISTAMICSFFIASTNIVVLLAGMNFLYPEVPYVFLWVGVGTVIFGIFQIYSRQYDLEQRNWQISRNWIFAMVTNLILNILLIPRMGILGAAVSTALAYCAGLIMAFSHTFSKFNIDFKLKRSGVFFIVCLLSSIMIQPIISKLDSWGIFVAGTLGLFFCFFGVFSGVVSLDLVKNVFHAKIKK